MAGRGAKRLSQLPAKEEARTWADASSAPAPASLNRVGPRFRASGFGCSRFLLVAISWYRSPDRGFFRLKGLKRVSDASDAFRRYWHVIGIAGRVREPARLLKQPAVTNSHPGHQRLSRAGSHGTTDNSHARRSPPAGHSARTSTSTSFRRRRGRTQCRGSV